MNINNLERSQRFIVLSHDMNILAGIIPIFYDKQGISNTFYDYHPVTYHTQLVML